MASPLEYIGRQWARFRLLWGRRWEPVSLRETIRSAEGLLVCLPEHEVPQAEELVALIKALPVRRTTVLCARPRALPVADLEMLMLSRDDVGWFRLPRKALRNRVTNGGFDMAIDLHRNFSIASAYLCALSGARLRVGLGSGDEGTFFNMHYRSDGTTLREACLGLARLFREIGGR